MVEKGDLDELSHLGIRGDDHAHQVRVLEQRLHQGRVHHLGHQLRIAHQLQIEAPRYHMGGRALINTAPRIREHTITISYNAGSGCKEPM